MKDKKNLITLIIGIIIGISIMGIVVCFTVDKLNLANKVYTSKFNESNDNVKGSITETKKQEENVETTSDKKEEPVKKETKSVVSKKDNTKKVIKQEEKKEIVASNDSHEVKEETKKTVEVVSEEITQFAEKLENEILTEENINKALQKAKQDFIKLTDFIFYGTEINGYTFNDLTEQTKLQLMSIAMRIDARLEEYKPGYKEEIKLKINDIENKLTIKYLEVSDKICTKMGSVACNQAKQDLQVLKGDINLTIDWLKVIASNSLSSLDSWYQIFKNSN